VQSIFEEVDRRRFFNNIGWQLVPGIYGSLREKSDVDLNLVFEQLQTVTSEIVIPNLFSEACSPSYTIK
jgi:hypothetical protein